MSVLSDYQDLLRRSDPSSPEREAYSNIVEAHETRNPPQAVEAAIANTHLALNWQQSHGPLERQRYYTKVLQLLQTALPQVQQSWNEKKE